MPTTQFVVPLHERYRGDVKHLKFRDFWLDPDGNIAVVPTWGHDNWADEHLAVDGRKLLDAGWAKKSSCRDFIFFSLSQPQLDLIFAWHVASGEEFDIDRFPLS